ncbi:MAG: hypothetical protein AB9917_22340 [Negativicutes bacterium]
MKCFHVTNTGGFIDRLSQYIQSPGNVSYDQSNDTAHAIARIYFSYC